MPHLLALSKTKPTKVYWLKQGKNMLNNDGVPILFIELPLLKGVLLHAWLEVSFDSQDKIPMCEIWVD